MRLRIGSVSVDVPTGWFDVTHDLPSGTPITLAMPNGEGALQFSVATYVSGENPDVTSSSLRDKLDGLANARGLSRVGELSEAALGLRMVWGDFRGVDECVRIWCATAGRDVVLVTYLVVRTSFHGLDAELEAATRIVESLRGEGEDEESLCRVCGFALPVDYRPWGRDGRTPTFDICPCCGVEFGSEDTDAMAIELWRTKWVEGGAVWWQPKLRPPDWDLEEQLGRLHRTNLSS